MYVCTACNKDKDLSDLGIFLLDVCTCEQECECECVCTCVCMYVYMYTNAYTYASIFKVTHGQMISMYVCVHIHTRIHICIHLQSNSQSDDKDAWCFHTHTWFSCICMHVCLYIFLDIADIYPNTNPTWYIFIYVCTYTHMCNIHTYIYGVNLCIWMLIIHFPEYCRHLSQHQHNMVRC